MRLCLAYNCLLYHGADDSDLIYAFHADQIYLYGLFCVAEDPLDLSVLQLFQIPFIFWGAVLVIFILSFSKIINYPLFNRPN